MKRLLLLVTTALALAASAATAGAAAWLPVQTISTSATGPSAVATDDAGRATAVWADGGAGASHVIARRIELGGALGEPLDLGRGESASVGATAGGGAVVSWWREGAAPGETEIVARAIAPDDTLGPEVVVATTTAWLESDPIVSVAPGGAAVVAWLVEDPGDPLPRLQARHVAADGTLGALIELGTADYGSVRAAITPDGVTRLLWERPRAGDGVTEVVVGRIDAAGAAAAGGPVAVSDGPLIGSPQLSSGSGGVVATWFEGDADAPEQTLSAARLPADGAVAEAPVVVDPAVAAGALSQVAAAVAPGGTATIVWDEASAAGTPVSARQLAPDGTLGTTWTLAQSPQPGVRAVFPFVRALGDGSLLAIWMLGLEPDGDRVYRSRVLAPDGTPTGEEQTLPVSPDLDGFDPRRLLVSVSAAGDGIAATHNDAGLLMAARFDGAGPVLEATVPETVVHGATASFSATASDPAGVASVAWQFGDGAGADGAAATHAYAAAGSYEVTLTATDGFGNSAVVRRTITVVEHDPGPGAGGPGGRDPDPGPGGRDPDPGGGDPGPGGGDPGPGGGDPGPGGGDPGPGGGDPGPGGGDPGPGGGDPGPGGGDPGRDPGGSGSDPGGGAGPGKPPAVRRAPARLTVTRAVRRGARVTVAGTLHRRASGRVTLVWRQRLGRATVTQTVRARIARGRFSVTLTLPRALAAARGAGRLTVTYAGDADTARASATRLVRLGGSRR